MITPYKRIIILVLDSVGCGVQEDYKKYHSQTSNTLLSVYKSRRSFSLPVLEDIGLGLIFGKTEAQGIAGKMRQKSAGNDTFAGIWEIFGIVFKKRFRSKKRGFTKSLIKKIENIIGMPIIGNEYISGFKALDKYYFAHKNKKGPILYLADDGVVLLAAHEKIISPQKLNIFGKKIVSLLKGEGISRVITRPFIDKIGNFKRTKNRKDFIAFNSKLNKSVLTGIGNTNIDFITTEHLYNILGNPKNTRFLHQSKDNSELIKKIVKEIKKGKDRKTILAFCLQDFDICGHKKDINGYAEKLIEFDKKLPQILKSLSTNDLLIITADHGCDPSIDIRGHTREFVPIIIYSKRIKKQRLWLGIRKTFADISQTINYNFSLPMNEVGGPIHEIF